MSSLAASRSNLDQARRMLAFARSGYKLLDRKRNVLMRELVQRLASASAKAAELEAERAKLFQAIQSAILTTGSEEVMKLSGSVAEETELKILRQSVMGVELPRLLLPDRKLQPSYGLFRSNENLDMAFAQALRVRKILFQVLENESAVRRLSAEIRRCSKRADSIDKIQIPRYEQEVKEISQALEEKDREELFRIKICKKLYVEAGE